MVLAHAQPQYEHALLQWVQVGLFALGAALWSTTGGRALLQVFLARLDDLWATLQGVFG